MSRGWVIAAAVAAGWVGWKAHQGGALGVQASGRIVAGVNVAAQQQAPPWASLPEHQKWLVPPPRAPRSPALYGMTDADIRSIGMLGAGG